MTQYKFTVNGQSQTGSLTWNAIATLSSLSITDSLYSPGAQSYSFSHDDLIRVATANCGSVWAQTFSYDAFGNLSKSGTVSFSPTYSYATKRMTQIGGSSPSYNANGNVTNDFLHTYAWDANGRPTTVDGVSVTYDAMGRTVEKLSGGTYTETVYSPFGTKLALMNGTSLVTAFVNLGGGSSVVYNSTGIQYYRRADWLGSYRVGSTSSRTLYYDGAYGPFGEPYAQSTSTDVSFTGMNQDIVTNLYDFPKREYGTQGRWPSPDPSGSASASPQDPRTWNRYAYVSNDPLGSLDSTGLLRTPPYGGYGSSINGDIGACVWDDGSSDDPDDPDTGTLASCEAQGGTFDNGLANSDYNPDPNSDLADLVGQIQNSYVVTVHSDLDPPDASWGAVFVANLIAVDPIPTAFRSFGEGGCNEILAHTVLEDLSPVPVGDSPGASDAIDATSKLASQSLYSAALTHAATAENALGGTGLLYPFKSSIFRGLMDASKAVEEAALPVAVVAATGHAVYKSAQAALNGECH